MYQTYRTQQLTMYDTLVVRRAVEMDFQAVMNIDRNIHPSLDFVPDLYFIYLQNKNHVVYVLEQNGFLVGMIIIILATL